MSGDIILSMIRIPDTYAGPLDAHGRCNQNDRGSRSFEVYENRNLLGWNGRAFFICGGDGVVFNSVLAFPSGTAFQLVDYRSNVDLCIQCGDPIDLQCASKINYPADYPMEDQIREAYFWNNTLNGNPVKPEVTTTNYTPLFIHEERHYYNYPKPGYTPLAYPHPFITDCGSYLLTCDAWTHSSAPPSGVRVR